MDKDETIEVIVSRRVNGQLISQTYTFNSKVIDAYWSAETVGNVVAATINDLRSSVKQAAVLAETNSSK